MAPFFSILTASCNGGATLEQTIQSVRSQSIQSYEHIIIDGGSVDTSLEILEKQCRTYNAQFISEPDRGIADALNKGLAIASGHYIVVIQADDQLYAPQTLAQVHSAIKEQQMDIFSCPVIFKKPDSGYIIRKPIKRIWWNRFKFIFPHQGTFVHRRVFEKIGKFREDFRINMDYDFFYRALNSHSSVSFGDFPVAIMGGDGISSKRENLRLRLDEERRVQHLNENSRFWRFAQLSFRTVYLPYKMWRLQRSSPR
jgi:glycosyltransferase involved in cell wall biosynthesis